MYEENHIEELAKLELTFRYQDDLLNLALNDEGLLKSVLCDIYPPEMIVNGSNSPVCKTNFLDLTISINKDKFFAKF